MTKKLPDTFSPRGFAQYGETSGTYTEKVAVYESSAVNGECVWVRIEAPSDLEAGEEAITVTAYAHLNYEQARELRDLLDMHLRHQRQKRA